MLPQFSTNIDNSESDILYSELMALYLACPIFFEFLNDEKWKYLTNSDVFNNSVMYELNNHPITINKELIKVNILNDWTILQKIPVIAKQLPVSENITVDTDRLIINNNIFQPKPKESVITQTDLLNVVGIDFENIYDSKEYSAYLRLFLSTIKNYLIPEYMIGITYFEQIYKERNIENNFRNYSTITTQGLGIRFDSLPNLYYNNFMNLCIDLLNYPPAFRDYQLLIDVWKKIKHSDLNIQILIPRLKEVNTDMTYFYNKYCGLTDYEYLTIENDNVTKRNKAGDNVDIYSKKYFKSKDSNIILEINETFRYNINSELAPSMFDINIHKI